MSSTVFPGKTSNSCPNHSHRHNLSVVVLLCINVVFPGSTGDYTLDYRTPSRAKSSVVKNTFYTRNGVFSSPSATDTLG